MKPHLVTLLLLVGVVVGGMLTAFTHASNEPTLEQYTIVSPDGSATTVLPLEDGSTKYIYHDNTQAVVTIDGKQYRIDVPEEIEAAEGPLYAYRRGDFIRIAFKPERKPYTYGSDYEVYCEDGVLKIWDGDRYIGALTYNTSLGKKILAHRRQ